MIKDSPWEKGDPAILKLHSEISWSYRKSILNQSKHLGFPQNNQQFFISQSSLYLCNSNWMIVLKYFQNCPSLRDWSRKSHDFYLTKSNQFIWHMNKNDSFYAKRNESDWFNLCACCWLVNFSIEWIRIIHFAH